MHLTRLLYKILDLFQSHSTHQGISLGVCVGMLLALSPISSLQFWLFLTLLFLLKLNLASTLFSSLSFALLGYLGTPLFFSLGDTFLTKPALLGFWSALYESPLIPFTSFYNPEILGKLLVTLTLAVPLFFISMKLCKMLDVVVYHWWRTTKLYTLYRSYKPYAR